MVRSRSPNDNASGGPTTIATSAAPRPEPVDVAPGEPGTLVRQPPPEDAGTWPGLGVQIWTVTGRMARSLVAVREAAGRPR